MPDYLATFSSGMVVWVCLDGSPWWPAVIVDRAAVECLLTLEHGKPLPPATPNNRLVEFFNAVDCIGVVHLRELVEYSLNLHKINHINADLNEVILACEQANEYIANHGLPAQRDFLRGISFRLPKTNEKCTSRTIAPHGAMRKFLWRGEVVPNSLPSNPKNEDHLQKRGLSDNVDDPVVPQVTKNAQKETVNDALPIASDSNKVKETMTYPTTKSLGVLNSALSGFFVANDLHSIPKSDERLQNKLTLRIQLYGANLNEIMWQHSFPLLELVSSVIWKPATTLTTGMHSVPKAVVSTKVADVFNMALSSFNSVNDISSIAKDDMHLQSTARLRIQVGGAGLNEIVWQQSLLLRELVL